MNANTDTSKKISEADWETFREALVSYYVEGPPITRAFDLAEPGLIDRYYRRRKDYPEEIERLNQEARTLALLERSGDEIAFESEQIQTSQKIQRAAVEQIKSALPEIARIARGESRVVRDEYTGKKKVMIVYPRDQLDAIKLLQSLARGGALPEGYRRGEVQAVPAQSTEPEPLLDLLGVSTSFTSVTAQAPDGRRFTATLEAGDVIEGEVKEHRG